MALTSYLISDILYLVIYSYSQFIIKLNEVRTLLINREDFGLDRPSRLRWLEAKFFSGCEKRVNKRKIKIFSPAFIIFHCGEIEGQRHDLRDLANAGVSYHAR